MKKWLILVAILGLAGCYRDRNTLPLVIAVPSTINTIDPYAENSSIAFSVLSNIYEPLILRNENLSMVPCLATRWRTLDDFTWVLTLRSGVTFHDGSPLTAVDVKYSLDRARDEQFSKISNALWMINSVEVLPQNEIRITTKERYSTLLNRLAEVLIVSRTHSAPPAGTGPYQLTDWKPGGFVRLQASKHYWGTPPAIQKAEFVTVPDLKQRINGLKDGTYQILPHLEPEAIHDTSVTQNPRLRVVSPQGLGVIYLGMDMEREVSPYVAPPSNPFRNILVRKAIYHAVNIRHIVQDILEGYAAPATQMVAPMIFGFKPGIGRLPYDPDRARALMKEAGYENGFSVRFDISKDRYRSDEEIGRSIASDLEKIGIQVKVNAMHRQDLFRTLNARDSSFYMVGWFLSSGDASSLFDYVVHSRDESRGYGRENVGGFSNPEIDQLIERSSGIMKPADRANALRSLMEMTMQQVPYIPLHVEQNFCAFDAGLNWKPRSDEFLYVHEIQWTED